MQIRTIQNAIKHRKINQNSQLVNLLTKLMCRIHRISMVMKIILPKFGSSFFFKIDRIILFEHLGTTSSISFGRIRNDKENDYSKGHHNKKNSKSNFFPDGEQTSLLKVGNISTVRSTTDGITLIEPTLADLIDEKSSELCLVSFTCVDEETNSSAESYSWSSKTLTKEVDNCLSLDNEKLSHHAKSQKNITSSEIIVSIFINKQLFNSGSSVSNRMNNDNRNTENRSNTPGRIMNAIQRSLRIQFKHMF